MPRVVDHDERRQMIARAFQRLVAAEGMMHTSFARVAAEAGTSIGTIQHYFDNREALLRYAFEDCVRQMERRIDARIAAGEEAGQPISTMMLDGLLETMPLDDERVVEHRVRQSLAAAAINHAGLSGVARQVGEHLQQRIATAVDNGKVCGEVEGGVDSEQAAMMILTCSEGLAASLGLRPDPAPVADVDRILGPVIAMVFTGRCRHHDPAA